MNTYTFRYKNITRELPIYEVDYGTCIAYLDTLSDFELVSVLSRDLAALISENDDFRASDNTVIFTAESKGVPFAYSVAHYLAETFGKRVSVVIARKREKMFFGKCVYAEKSSITTEHGVERLLVTEDDVKKMKNNDVVLLDDFYSTGASMKCLESLATQCGARIIDRVVALWETSDENKPDVKDVKYLATIPIL